MAIDADLTDTEANWHHHDHKIAMREASEHRGTHRALCVTLECGHLSLRAATGTVMGVGALTVCRVCPADPDEPVTRMLCKVEETGVLHDSWATFDRDRIIRGR